MRARPAGIIGPAKSDERGRITFHDASKAKERVRPRPPSLSLSLAIGGAVALVINGVRGGNMQR